MKPKIIINDKNHLKIIIKQEVSTNGNKCDLNHLDVSNVTNMNGMFRSSKFNGDISKWNVSNVTEMNSMFIYSQFNGDISTWDVSNVTNMNFMFFNSKFNGDISSWNVSNVTDMSYMFSISQFNNNVDDWKPYKLNNKKNMFDACTAPIPYWYTAENTQKSINSYELQEKLNINLEDKNIIKIKVKI